MIIFRPFERRLDRASFSCGNEALDEWFRLHAGHQEKQHTARTFLGVDERQIRIASYFSLVTSRIELADLPGTALAASRYPMSAMLLARLAVDLDYQGQGIGKTTLVEALERLVALSEQVAFEVVVVDAVDADAAKFYRRFGFAELSDDGGRLFMTTADLRKTFTAAER